MDGRSAVVAFFDQLEQNLRLEEVVTAYGRVGFNLKKKLQCIGDVYGKVKSLLLCGEVHL